MYSKINEYDYGIQSLKPIFDETRVQLGLDLSANGNFTFNVKENSLNENIKIYLLDNETGVEIEINANRNYTFEASAGSSERFTLIFRKMGLPTELENIANNENYLVYTNKTTLFVKTTNRVIPSSVCPKAKHRHSLLECLKSSNKRSGSLKNTSSTIVILSVSLPAIFLQNHS